MKTRIFEDIPCTEGARWLVRQPDAQTAWKKCKRPDWMVWALRNSVHGHLLTKEICLKIAQFLQKTMETHRVKSTEAGVFRKTEWLVSDMQETIKILESGKFNDRDMFPGEYADELDFALNTATEVLDECFPTDRTSFNACQKEIADFIRTLIPEIPE